MKHSAYEKSGNIKQGQTNGICLGAIASVDVDTRLCRVKTFFGPPELLDLDLKDVQWVNVDGNADGDESGSIPREGAMGLVFFIEGSPFIFGFIKPLNADKGAVTGKESVSRLVRGDKIISTKNGNYITIRTNGSIEIQSRESCKTVYIPTESRIQEVCRNFNFKTSGGFIRWEEEGLTNTIFNQEFRRDLLRSFVVLEERGALGGSTIYRTSMGPGIPGVPGVPAAIYSFEVDITGNTKLTIGAGLPVMSAEIKPTGAIAVDNISDIDITTKLGSVTIKAQAKDITLNAPLGDIALLSNAGNISVKTDAGNISAQTSLGNITAQTTSGSVELNGSLGRLKLSKGKVGIGGPAAELLDLFDQTLDGLKDLATSMATETHLGNLGYNTSPPLNTADYIKFVATIIQIKTFLTTIKGGV